MAALRPLPWQAAQWQAVASALEQQRLAHALLLAGPQGIGKRHFTRVLAQSLLCRQRVDTQLPCGQCRSCVLLQAGTHPDLFRLEKVEDSKEIRVDDLREFNRKVFLTSKMEQGIVGVIDPVDGLNRSSVNALLKSLEEPPPGAHILLIGERWMGLPATLRSRCLILRFIPPPAAEAVDWLHRQATDATEWAALRQRFEPDLGARLRRADALAALCQRQEDPVILAERWQKAEVDLPELLDWLHGCVADLFKLKAGWPQGSLYNPQSLKALQALASRLSACTLHDLARLGLETRYLLERSQARPQMLLENLLASWYQGAGSASGRCGGETQT